jgi:hypothetical protein
MTARRRSPSMTDWPFLPPPDPQPAKRRGGRASRQKVNRVERLSAAAGGGLRCPARATPNSGRSTSALNLPPALPLKAAELNDDIPF